MTRDYPRYIVRDPKTCDGEAIVNGTRVTVRASARITSTFGRL